MKTLLLTGYDDKFAKLGDLTAPLMHSYAMRHGFDFECMRSGVKMHPSWWKMYRTKEALVRYDRVIWLDADIIVTNPAKVPPGEKGFHCSMDWGRDATERWHVSSCGFMAFQDGLPLVEWVIENQDVYPKDFNEQEHIRQAIKNPFSDISTVHPRRVFNAVPVEVHETVVDRWRDGDWCAHLTMVPLSQRIKLFHQLRSRCRP